MNYQSENCEYNLYIVSLNGIRSYFNAVINKVANDYSYNELDYEHIYDWVISEAFTRIHKTDTIIVLSHHRHDFYRCIYTEIGYQIEMILKSNLQQNRILFIQSDIVKLMVAGNNLIIAKMIY